MMDDRGFGTRAAVVGVDGGGGAGGGEHAVPHGLLREGRGTLDLLVHETQTKERGSRATPTGHSRDHHRHRRERSSVMRKNKTTKIETRG